MKKVLVTGGSGFVGQAVIKALLSESEVDIHVVGRQKSVDYNSVTFHECDLMDTKATAQVIKETQPEYLIHLAWNVEHATYLNSADNLPWIGASLNLIKNFAENGGKRIFISGTCFEEVEPLSLYATSKISLCQITQKYCETAQVSLAWGRLFFLFGEGERITRVIPYALTELIKGNQVTCKNSMAIRDFMYIEDAGRAIVKTLFSDVEGILDIATGNKITMGEIFQEIGSVCHNHSCVLLENRPVIPQNVIANTTNLEQIVGFKEYTDLRIALERTLDYWKGVRT